MKKYGQMVLGLAVLGLTSGCGGTNCTDEYVYGIRATLVDGASQLGVCQGQVTIQDGAYTEQLQCGTVGANCDCYGAGERAGTYTVTATRGSIETQTVTVESDECHVKTQTLTFFD